MRNKSQINPIFLLMIVVLVFSSYRAGAYSSPQDWLLYKILVLPGIIIGLSFHEFAHAWTAWKLHDPTPKMQGRVTINPIAHIDWLGFAALLFCGFGWGQPVEINPNNFRKRRRDEFIVSIAGVTTNLIVALIFAVIARIILSVVGVTGIAEGLGNILWQMVMGVITINLVLMIFNLIPVPPLDGFSIIGEIFNLKTTDLYWNVYNYGNLILFALIIFNITDMIISPCVNALMTLITNVIIC